jgi:hypothetical protein
MPTWLPSSSRDQTLKTWYFEHKPLTLYGQTIVYTVPFLLVDIAYLEIALLS